MKRELWKSKGFLSKAAKEENRKSRGIYPVAMAAAMMAALLLSGCGAAGLSTDSAMPAVATEYNGSSASYAAGGAYDTGYMEAGNAVYDSMTPMESLSEESAAFSSLPQDRKLIRTVELEMETKEFERMMSELEAQVQELGGYIENMETYNGSSYTGHRSSRWANLAIRIPKEALNSFLENMSVIGNVVRRSDSVEDVTLNYVDMESRRDTLKAEQARLLELLEKAETVEDMIALEERLSNVRYGLESMESQLRTIDNQVDYSTVNLYLSEVKELTPVEEKTDLQRITEGFADSLKDIGNGIKEGAIWFVVNIPYLVIWAAVIAAAVVILRKWLRKRKEKRAALKMKAEAVPKNTDGAEQSVETGKDDSHQ
ncbi:MAG: DUF4349 domain-containing protein [Lachnospiraceae bacterium]|nr:DUF4349 domain-containing protein [Butyrivibrio sp.]MCM1344725.1 DUF4349 domain-containing protein [Muribaculaceae bacterium]MCM1412016.1 DUF4349 domain-containing protein [Lachnospiraceae bacterium]